MEIVNHQKTLMWNRDYVSIVTQVIVKQFHGLKLHMEKSESSESGCLMITNIKSSHFKEKLVFDVRLQSARLQKELTSGKKWHAVEYLRSFSILAFIEMAQLFDHKLISTNE